MPLNELNERPATRSRSRSRRRQEADDTADASNRRVPTRSPSYSKGLGHARKDQHNQEVHPPFRSDPYEHPRQVSITLCLIGLLGAISAFSPRRGDDESNYYEIRPAVFSVFLSFVTLAYLQTRDLILAWPHPGYWRLIFAGCAFYCLCLVGLLQVPSKDMARSAIAYVFPDIGTLEEFHTGLYTRIDDVMGTCEISRTALMRQFFHCPWVFAHASGWAVKMLVFRDYYMAFFAAAVFELLEVTLIHAVPEFEECWWDSIFLDTLGANLLGMFIGQKINEWIRSSSTQAGEKRAEHELGSDLDWIGRGAHRGVVIVSSASASLEHYNWEVFSSLRRLLQVVGVAVFMSISDLNTFLLINSLGIANNTSWFVLCRLFIVTMIWIPAGAEYYSYITESESASVRLGPSIWILCCTTAAELAVAIKFFPEHMFVELENAGNVM